MWEEARNLAEVRPLPSPRALRAEQPCGARAAATVQRGRREIRDALHGRDPRLVVIAGPCSLDDADAALEYAGRLRRVDEALRSELVLVMRAYVEKPRTALGWKGLVNDPAVDGSCDVGAGLALARELLIALAEVGVPCASELLDPLTPAYLGDLLSWGGVGARTVESQPHRLLASGVAMPVGFKNATDGGIEAARDAMRVAAEPHSFVGMGDDGAPVAVRTRGNPDLHLVLRGGRRGPNYGPEMVERAVQSAVQQGVARPVLVDCSHANSDRDPARQPEVCRAVLEQLRRGRRELLGVLLESHLRGGRQPAESPVAARRYGVSITDACLGWNETEDLLNEIAEAVKLAR